MQKLVKIADLAVEVLIDTGRKIMVIGERFLLGVPLPPPLNSVSLQLEGYGSSDIISIGCFAAAIHIDEHEFNTTVYVTNFSQKIIPFDIGRNVIS